MPALVALAAALSLVPPLVVPVLLLPLLLHAAMASVEVATATTAASVLLIAPPSGSRPEASGGRGSAGFI
jgi:hypothetical protein